MKDKEARERIEQLTEVIDYRSSQATDRYWQLREDVDLIMKHLKLTVEIIPRQRVLATKGGPERDNS